ncbi:bifunctional hydroxymethylpyrimidine kinase/phosphomethylpyrimidine kinase [Endozoicomonas sp.]|uniref:bifunctional hydroxymethylpyrimidine kinase/phosphomethylpyrimidine kinase n=1 Tax=Endozoicomonas sp. TaxID=1892382 RepID=UPI0028874761|nr:bifunctional hydroxymethylpyrimidine kinase/phosphomethylpyrimidine kinase [Endozoicomonas sp.]
MPSTPIALTIAGSDSGGGAGIQADLKTFSALGVYGCSVITALTAQNTLGVQGIFDVTPAFVRQQLDSVFSDLNILAAKVGMLSQPEVIETVARAVSDYPLKNLVVDPVMVATSGDVLLQKAAIDILRRKLIPKATLITPNLPEAAVLLDCSPPESLEAMIAMVDPLMELGASAVLLKGGHLSSGNGKAVDLFHDGKALHKLESPWVKTRNTHGTGCTLSSAVTAYLARDYSLMDAVKSAKEYIAGAIAHADNISISKNRNDGHGPVHHFYRTW